MMDKFKNEYRIASARLSHWDYGWNAAYFVTIGTKDRECFLGGVETRRDVETRCIASLPCIASLRLSDIGKIVETEWLKTPEIRPDMNLELGEFVVMPNHFHGIIMIGKNEFNINQGVEYGRDAMHRVSTSNANNRFAPQSKNLASIVRGFKSSVTMQARKINPGFAWQPRFYDHIIRNDAAHQRIAQYIINNPQNWKEDEMNCCWDVV
ncbi:MAG: hypothetical protein ABIK15_11325 [Pseudomonadota bacterium]